ncbi:hypothetical protein [Prevotella sp.]|uniref:hypothetical protein n=1 Tax=Prevotella sp. TaxID=59823 RepID=UPI002F95D432
MENKENILCMLFILAMVCSCNSKVDPELIYGYWACNDTVMSLKPSQPIGPKLDLFSLQEAWIDPVISDTIYYFNSCKVQNDTLVLQDEDKIFKYRIKELSDSILKIESDKKYYTYKLKKSYRNNTIHFRNSITAKNFHVDSLDIIIKSKRTNSDFGSQWYIINKYEMIKARNLFFSFIGNQEYKSNKQDTHLVLKSPNEYFRQYIGEKVGKTIYVYVIIIDSFIDFSGYMQLKEMAMFNRGYTIKINLTQNQIIDFWNNEHSI